MLQYLHLVFFISLYLSTSAYALGRGGGPERWAVAIMAMGVVLTTILIGPAGRRFHQPEYGVATGDALMLVAFVWLALTADRFWPIWVASIQTVIVLCHLAMILKPVPLPVYYQNTVNLWSYPQLVLLAAGTLRHRLRTGDANRFERWLGRTGCSLVGRFAHEQRRQKSQ